MSGDAIVWGIELGQMNDALADHENRGFELQELLIAPDGKAVMWFTPLEVQEAQLPTIPPGYVNLGRRRQEPKRAWGPDWAPGMLPAGVYRHYKGPLYLVLGLAHDANAEDLVRREDIFLRDHDFTEMGERVVVVYVGLQLDAAKEGPRLAVRTLEDFNEVVCSVPAHAHFGGTPVDDACNPHRRFEYLGAIFTAGMEGR